MGRHNVLCRKLGSSAQRGPEGSAGLISGYAYEVNQIEYQLGMRALAGIGRHVSTIHAAVSMDTANVLWQYQYDGLFVSSYKEVCATLCGQLGSSR